MLVLELEKIIFGNNIIGSAHSDSDYIATYITKCNIIDILVFNSTSHEEVPVIWRYAFVMD